MNFLILFLNFALAANSSIETQISQGQYSNDDRMNELSVRAQTSTVPKLNLGVDLGYKNAFNTESFMASPFAVWDFHERWYATGSILFSTEGTLYPARSFYGEIFHKLGAEQKWILGLGGNNTRYDNGNYENTLVSDLVYYHSAWFIAQTGLRHTNSYPSKENFQRFYGAATLIWKQNTFVLRYEKGREAYAYLGQTTPEVFNFSSESFSTSVIMALSAEWQIKFLADFYKSEFIKKQTFGVSLIKKF